MAREKITEIRKSRKLSQAALGRLSGLTGSEVSRIECGYRDVSREEADAIAKALGVPLVAIYDQPEMLVPKTPVGLAAARQATPPTTPPVEGLLSVGSDLNYPANFQEMPNQSLLAQGSLATEEFRVRLTEALNRATKILHTSRVPAAVWRAWREFERKTQEALRNASAGAGQIR